MGNKNKKILKKRWEDKQFRKKILDCCKTYQGGDINKDIDEKTDFFMVCEDDLDFIELIMYCEKQIGCYIEEGIETNNSFLKIEDFITWFAAEMKL
jgi:hypothetical protein